MGILHRLCTTVYGGQVSLRYGTEVAGMAWAADGASATLTLAPAADADAEGPAAAPRALPVHSEPAAAPSAPAAPATSVVDPSVITPLDLSAAGRHHGPVTAVQRNPFYTSGVLSVGDWGFRLWHDKNKSPILTSPYCAAFLKAGCWSN